MIIEEIPEEIKILIHHILNKYKFYRLNMMHYRQFLFLLNQQFIQDPVSIQQQIFKGIVSFNKVYKDRIAPILTRPYFQSVSIESKLFIHKILHQFNFLLTIKAFQMIQQNRHINLFNNSLFSTSLSNQTPFDDQYQRFRLNYMYYRSLTVFHLDSIFKKHQNNVQIPQSYHYMNHFQRNQYKIAQLYHKKNNSQSQKTRNQYNFQQIKIKKMKNNEKQQKFKVNYMIQQDSDSQKFKNCVCKGKYTSYQIFLCKCGFYYHKKCLKTQNICIRCLIKQIDPFIQVKEFISQFYINQWRNNSQQINLKCQKLRKIKKGEEIMMSSWMIGDQGIHWPDDILFKLNQTPVFAIPALLKNHPKKNRQDSSYFITEYIYNQDIQNTSQIKCSFSMIQQQYSQKTLLKRSNLNQTFFISISIVQERSIKQLTDEIKNKQKYKQRIHPLIKINNDAQMQIQSIQISCLDPYSKNILNVPVKGNNCTHFNCFDLQTYLNIMFYSQKRNWKCPICKKDARILEIEKYQEYILDKIRHMNNPPDKLIYYNNMQQDNKLGVQLPFQQFQYDKNQ